MARTTAFFVAAWLGLAAPQLAAADQAGGPPSAEAIAAARAAVADADLERVASDRAYASEVLGHLDLLAGVPDVYAELDRSIETLRLQPLLTLGRTDEVRATIDRLLALRLNEAEQYRLPIYAACRSRISAVCGGGGHREPQRPGIGWGALRELLNRDSSGLCSTAPPRGQAGADPPRRRSFPDRLAGRTDTARIRCAWSCWRTRWIAAIVRQRPLRGRDKFARALAPLRS